MKNLLIVAWVAVLVSVSAPRAAAGQESAGGTVTRSSSIGTIGWNMRPPGQLHPEIPARPSEPSPVGPSDTETMCAEIPEETRHENPSMTLRPVKFFGIWVFPPGGMTRYLIPSRVIINVVSKVDAAPESGSG